MTVKHVDEGNSIKFKSLAGKRTTYVLLMEWVNSFVVIFLNEK